MQIQSLGREDSLEKEIATHSSILAGKIPWTEEPMGSLSTSAHHYHLQRLSGVGPRQGGGLDETVQRNLTKRESLCHSLIVLYCVPHCECVFLISLGII